MKRSSKTRLPGNVQGDSPIFVDAKVGTAPQLRPWLLCGLTALLVARPLFPSESAATHGDGMAMVMLWIALGLLWALGTVLRSPASKATGPFSPTRKSEQSPAIRCGWTDLAVLLLIVWHTAAALWAVKHGSPRPAINMLWEWIGLGLCFFLARQLIVTPREVRAMVAVMIALAAGLSGYGLYQRTFEFPQTRAEYAADPDRALREADLQYPAGSPERMLFESRLNNPEPFATFALTNSLAAFLAPWMVLLAGILLSSWQDRKRLLWMLLCFLLIVACLLLTKSRSGIVAAGVGIVLLCLFRKWTFRIGWKTVSTTAIIAAILIVAAVVIGNRHREAVSLAIKSFGYRVQYWQSSLEMIADHPWVGCGPGNYQNAYTRYKMPEASEEIADPHDFLLEIGSTAGVPALVVFLGVLGCFAWAQRRGLDSEDQGRESEARTKGEGRRGKGEKRITSRWGVSLTAAPTDSLADPTETDAWRYVLGGGAIGFMLSLPLGILSAAPPGMIALFIGLTVAIAATAGMLSWIRDGRLPRLLPAIGVAVLLIDLLTTGGIGFPSVAATLWLLLALGLQGERPRAFRGDAGCWGGSCTATPGSAVQLPPQRNQKFSSGRLLLIRGYVAWASLLAMIGLAVACFQSAYDPVLNCQTQLRMAEQDPAQAIECLEAAAAADPLSSEAWKKLAEIRFALWRESPNEHAFQRFEQAKEKFLTCEPNSASAWFMAGEWYCQASSATERTEKKFADRALQKSVTSFREAVLLYPNSAIYRAKLAEACLSAGDKSEFRQEAETALRLDQATPHLDKKLPAALRERLLQELKAQP